MNTSLFDLFKVGIGPSSSHTMGPMRAARCFALYLRDSGLLSQVASVRVELYGSLALTGRGHGTDRAILLGLTGEDAATIDPTGVDLKLCAIRASGNLLILGSQTVRFCEADDLLFFPEQMIPPGAVKKHPNGIRFAALDREGGQLLTRTYFSIGGGFIIGDGEEQRPTLTAKPLPYPFQNAIELLCMARHHKLAIWQIAFANECALRSEAQVRSGILHIWLIMNECIRQGMATEGFLPGGLNVRRRAPRLAARLREQGSGDPLSRLDWVTVFAMAVNEQNAAGGRVVTAPTNGAAGIIPAVVRYYCDFTRGADDEGIIRFFLTASAIGALYKENASISGAEVGCQGEVGVACSMAAGALAAALNGTNGQVEHSAEIAMEHNLGMTCDPIGGLVQIPCIERNALGAVKAIQACRIAMNETETHKVSLDQVIRTMYLTGLDMQSKYKETAQAGLALNVIEC